MLAAGDIEGFIAPRAPSLKPRTPNVGWLFSDPVAAAKDYYRRTKIFPIMHIVGLRRSLAEQHPWLAGAIYKAFVQSKTAALQHLIDTSATKVTLPFVEERLKEAQELRGDDFWSYGIEGNRHVLEKFYEQHHSEGLSARKVTPEMMFHPATHELVKI
jgi:4,5-dihydroxyphthalate decarboxylase